MNRVFSLIHLPLIALLTSLCVSLPLAAQEGAALEAEDAEIVARRFFGSFDCLTCNILRFRQEFQKVFGYRLHCWKLQGQVVDDLCLGNLAGHILRLLLQL